MTTLIAVQRPGDVIIGWDSLTTRGNESVVVPSPKFFVVGGAVIGVSGTLRALDVIETMEIEDYDGSNPRLWLIKTFVPALRAAIANEPAMFTDDGKEVTFGLMAVVGGQAFDFDSLLSPSGSVEGIHTMGSGGDYARGALYAARMQYVDTGLLWVPDEEDVMTALYAARAIDPYTGGILFVTKASNYLKEWGRHG